MAKAKMKRSDPKVFLEAVDYAMYMAAHQHPYMRPVVVVQDGPRAGLWLICYYDKENECFFLYQILNFNKPEFVDWGMADLGQSIWDKDLIEDIKSDVPVEVWGVVTLEGRQKQINPAMYWPGQPAWR